MPSWDKENPPRWDERKDSIFGEADLAAVGLERRRVGEPVADEWWRVVDDAGDVVGYGWLDSEWGDARISFLVAPSRRGQNYGAFILERLEDEAARRGLNHIYNIIPASHPDREWMSAWLSRHGFTGSDRHMLQRSVRHHRSATT
jgi:GNAT superfamily N-acetyltransferase